LRASRQADMARVAIDDLKERSRVIEEASQRDKLTGLYNRARFDEYLNEQFTQVQRTGKPLSVIMVDVDHFKQVNDSYGHQVSDHLLRAVGVAVADNVRHDDVVYRYGGEQFCVLLPGATPGEAQAVADRVVGAMRSILLPDGRHVTVSVGVADGREGDRSEGRAEGGGRPG
jgi:diguanylate cyclase (GGDEF)-like protein